MLIAQRYPVSPLPTWLWERQEADLAIGEVFRKNAVFVGAWVGDDFRPKGSGFIVSIKEDQYTFHYIVTAEHVVTGMHGDGYKTPCIRMNRVDGNMVAYEAPYSDWIFHPEPTAAIRTDVAIFLQQLDRREVIFSITPPEAFVTQERMEQFDIGVGTEVAIIGLFTNHYGRGKNIPVVRTGNIAAMPEEPIKTRYVGYIDAYLIEARSIGGLSGSPVWVRVGPWKIDYEAKRANLIGEHEYLLGLVHGHFDVENLDGDVVTDSETGGKINTGIGVVIPAQRIIETLMCDDAKAQRAEGIRRAKAKEPGATADLASEPSTTPDNPQHREDFRSLLNAAAKGRKAD